LTLAIFWFLTGMLITLACVIMLLPLLRTNPRVAALPKNFWQAGIGAGVIVLAVVGLYRWLGHPELAAQPAGLAASNRFKDALMMSNNANSTAPASSTATASSAPPSNAGSMNAAIASLEARLAKGGGSADDWELLAKSFEFLGRPADASKARARQLPPLPLDSDAPAAVPAASAASARMAAPPSTAGPAGAAVSGEVSLAPALRAKAAAGATLFIVAKSVDSPGAPVAVFRGTVGDWPFKFKLDDSQSMMPGRNLSSAGRVTIEARISQSGQPMPSAGDLRGSTGAINPADHQALKIVIDQVVS
jgi:cytochrome c-type biogenesis protein CcmH